MTSTLHLTEATSSGATPEGRMVLAHAVALSTTITHLTRTQVLERAQTWIDERVPYSQTKWHENRFGKYRQDCSGYVSMCWALGTSYTTATVTQVADTIPRGDLQAGDALWRRANGQGHIALFAGWADDAHTKPIVMEEYDFGHVCERRQWSPAYAGQFTPIRSRNLTQTPGGTAQNAVFRTWGVGVRIRRGPAADTDVLATLPGPTVVEVSCQVHGQQVTSDGITNDGWAFLPSYGGYLSNIYIDHPAYWLPGVPTCG